MSKGTNTRDDVLRRMLKTPPKPHAPLGKKREKPKPNQPKAQNDDDKGGRAS